MTLSIPYFVALATYFSYITLFVLGHLRDLLRGLLGGIDKPPKGYAPLCRDYEDFYTRRLYKKLEGCWNRPIASAPDAWIDVMERKRVRKPGSMPTMQRTGTQRKCLNLGSYNYLGFAASDEYCTPRVIEALNNYGPGVCSSRMEGGTTEKHTELEGLVARFVGKPAALVLGMGFATNSTTLPTLVGKGDLIVSDSNNHASIVAGARLSGARIKVFRHNNPEDLERVLREAIAEGQPRTHRPWHKIVIIVEGIYSMEGEVCCLREIVALKKKYKAYLYLDEAHSIGCMGRTGRGVCEHLDVDTADVDVMMGTFTKSFGSCGGYIAGSVELIQYLRHACPGSLYAEAMSVPAVEQCISSIKVLLGEDGTDRGARKLQQLHDNSNWFRCGLRAIGCEVLGDEDSPVMPLMLYCPGKIEAFSQECLANNIAVVVVGFPATPLLLSRARICISASHTREDLEIAMQVLDHIADKLQIKYGTAELPMAIPELEAADAVMDEDSKNLLQLDDESVDSDDSMPDGKAQVPLANGSHNAFSNGEAHSKLKDSYGDLAVEGNGLHTENKGETPKANGWH